MALDEGAASGVQAVLTRLDALTVQSDVTLRDVVDAFGDTAFIPLMMVPALIVVSPLSGIPLLPTVLGLVIASVALQSLLRKQRLWLPEMLLRRRVGGARLHRTIERLRKTADWVDRHTGSRMTFLARPPLDAAPKALCMISGAAMPFLELVPFSSSILGVAVVLLSTSLLVGDGLFALLGTIVMGMAAAVPVLVYGSLLGLAA